MNGKGALLPCRALGSWCGRSTDRDIRNQLLEIGVHVVIGCEGLTVKEKQTPRRARPATPSIVVPTRKGVGLERPAPKPPANCPACPARTPPASSRSTILRFAALQLGRRRRDDPRLRPPAADGLRISAGHRPVPASAHVRHRRRRTAGAVPRGRSATARSYGLAAGAGAGLASRRTRPRPGGLGAAPRGGGCPTEGPRPTDATHGRASVGVDARPPQCAGRRRRRRSALASAPHQDRLVDPVGRWHEAASGEAGPRRRRREELRPVRGVLPARRAVGADPRSVLGANRVPRRSPACPVLRSTAS